MEQSALSNNMLFLGMNEAEIKEALRLLEAREKRYERGELIFHAGSLTSLMGIV